MTERGPRLRLPGGLRTRLAATIVLLIVVLGGVSFLAVDRATRSELESRIDEELEEQYAEFEQQVDDRDLSPPAALERAATEFIDSQRYHAESRIFLIEVAGGDRQVTSHPELVEGEIERELEEEDEDEDEESKLLVTPDGYSEVSTDDTGELRVFTEPIVDRGERVGTFRVADPLESVADAQTELRNAFLVVGLAAILLSIAAAVVVANRITAPLRRAATVATEIDAGDLSPRLDTSGGDEVARLAGSLNGMLDRLERAFERERAFVSDASHELRTPLTVLRGQVELLQRSGGDPGERTRIAEALLREIGRMTRLVDDMLTLARAEDAGFVERRQIELDDLLADLERDLPLLGPRDYAVSGTREGTIEADPDRLSQVFRNLVGNAVEHTRPGDRIEVVVRPRNGSIEFAVTDDGPGIPAAELPLVFERFHRVDAGRSRESGGAGIGLAIARAIVEAHGGRIWAESEPGAGATIRFELPRFDRTATQR